MRKPLSILLFAALLLPLFAPLLQGQTGAEATLPACCRRAGKHHCMMTMAQKSELASAADQDPKWKAPLERCPFGPAMASAGHVHELHALLAARTHDLPIAFSHPCGRAQTEAKRRLARDRSRQKRGPPSLSV